ncbi:MAG: hypothetical protein KC646_13790 [Candidatus Cloacimonetes bacterium]|nr:hypothetical protein [Candidatus Cloacimonadota bacterium]
MSISKFISLIMILGTLNLVFWFFVTDFSIPTEIRQSVFNSQNKPKSEAFLFQQFQPSQIQVKLSDDQVAKLLSNQKFATKIHSLSKSLNTLKISKPRKSPIFPIEIAEVGKLRIFPKINFYPIKNQIRLLIFLAEQNLETKNQKQAIKHYVAAYTLAQSIEHMPGMKKPYLSTIPQVASLGLKSKVLTSVLTAMEQSSLTTKNSKYLINLLKPMLKNDLDYEFYLKTTYAEFQQTQYNAMMEFMKDNFNKEGRLYEWCLYFLYEAYNKTIQLQKMHLKNEIELYKKSQSYSELEYSLEDYHNKQGYSKNSLVSRMITFIAGVFYPKYVITKNTENMAELNCSLAFLSTKFTKPFEKFFELKEEVLIHE